MNQTETAVNRSAGLKQMTVFDRGTGISFPMLVFYPTSAPSEKRMIGPFPFDVASDAEVEDGIFPVVLISHGSGGSHLVYRSLATYLAKNGFIVCVPEHPFNNRNDNAWENSINNLLHRPRHAGLSLDSLFSHEQFKDRAKKDSVAMIGHSMGGYTALVAAGGIPSMDHFFKEDVIRYMHDLPRGGLDVSADERVRAIVLFAPGTAWFLPEKSLDRVRLPILLFTAEKDEYTAGQEQILLDGLPDLSRLRHRIIKNAGHFSFLSPFPDSVKDRVGPVAHDPEGFDREQFQKELSRDVLEFLHEELQVDPYL